MKKSVIFLVIVGSLIACNPSNSTQDSAVSLGLDLSPIDTEEGRRILIGTWYGRQKTQGGGEVEEIAVLKKDGTYDFKFRYIDSNDKIQLGREVGIWGISGNIHFTISAGEYIEGTFSKKNPEDASNYIAYKIIELNQESFKYQTVVTGNVFSLNKVNDGFLFPKKK